MAIAFRPPEIGTNGPIGKDTPKKSIPNQPSQANNHENVPENPQNEERSEVDSTIQPNNGGSSTGKKTELHCKVHKCSITMSSTSSSCLFVILSFAIWVIAFTIIATLTYICDDNCSYLCRLCCADGELTCERGASGAEEASTSAGSSSSQSRKCQQCGRTRQPQTVQSGDNTKPDQSTTKSSE